MELKTNRLGKCNRFQNIRTEVHMYKEYTKTIKSPKSLFNVPYPVFRAVVIDFFRLKLQDILLKGGRLEMPYKLGTIIVLKFKNRFNNWKKMRTDFAVLREKGIVTKHINEHTNGHYYKMVWRRSSGRIAGRRLYTFHPARKTNRQLAAVLKDPERTIDYFEHKSYDGIKSKERSQWGYKKPYHPQG